MTDESLPAAVAETLAKAAVAVLVPYGGGAVVIWEGVRDRLSGRMQRSANETFSQVDPDLLAARLADSPELDALLINALDSAARSGLEAKRRLLSKVVINAALDDARVDEGVLIEQAIRELEAPHLRAMARIDAAWKGRRVEEQDRLRYPGQTDDQLLPSLQGEAAYEAGLREPDPVIATLVRAGVAAPATLIGGGIGVHKITTFGRSLLAELQEPMLA